MAVQFKTNRFSIRVDEKGNSVTAETYEPTNPTAVLILAHGAGTNMDHVFLKELAAGLASRRVCVARYNFLYTEQKKKMPDRFPTASKVIKSVITDCHKRFPQLPLFCSGKSFGGRMTSMTLAEERPEFIKGIIFYGFPLHPPGSPSVERAEHLKEVDVPMLFLQGTKDTLAYIDLITKVTNSIASATLVSFDGADHSFKKGKQTNIPQLIEHTIEWMSKHV